MEKRIRIAVAAAGVFIILLSLILAVVRTANAEIIGGADLPTFLFYFRTKYMWLTELGVVIIIVSVVGSLKRKK
ncbi:MAG: hypothetical protein IJX37_05830 [Oscillospiraceae bacterium]|nr:hypothetical protein [Oscillospiraceae bacterium]